MSGGSSNRSDAEPTSITLSFGGPSSALWDDGELVRSYDAAMSEFHAHHPGPGTWLDKATAALALGNPLPGSQAFDTQWYSATGQPDPSASAQLDRRPQKRKRNTAAQSDNVKPNPYMAGSTHMAGGRSLPSPVFHPPSPHGLSPSPLPSQPHSRPESAGLANQDTGIHPVSTVSEEQAIGYAMQAQYMAGYWMGFAQARRDAAAAQGALPESGST